MLNGINLDGLGKYVELITEKPVEAISSYGITAKWLGGVNTEIMTHNQMLGTTLKHLTKGPINQLRELGCIIEDSKYRTSNLFGIRFHESIDLQQLETEFVKNKIYTSLRGTAVRISANVYNDANDMDKLVECLKNVVKGSA